MCHFEKFKIHFSKMRSHDFKGKTFICNTCYCCCSQLFSKLHMKFKFHKHRNGLWKNEIHHGTWRNSQITLPDALWKCEWLYNILPLLLLFSSNHWQPFLCLCTENMFAPSTHVSYPHQNIFDDAVSWSKKTVHTKRK